MKKLILVVLVMLLGMGVVFASDVAVIRPSGGNHCQASDDGHLITSGGDEFVITQSFASLLALQLYATTATSITAAGYDFSPTSATFFLTTELASFTTSFLWDEIPSGDNTLAGLISWGNAYTFKGLTAYYVAGSTESSAMFQVNADSVTLWTVAGLYPGATNYTFAAFATVATLIARIEADDESTDTGLQGEWVLTAVGTGASTNLVTNIAGNDVLTVTNVTHFPITPYGAGGEGWVFNAYDSSTVYTVELSTNLCVTANSRKTDTSTLAVAQQATISWDYRRYLNFNIDMDASEYIGMRMYLQNLHTYAVFAIGTTNTQIFEDDTQRYPNNSVTTSVIDEMDFANGVYVADEGADINIRVDSGASGHISNGWLRIYGWRR